MKRIISLLLTVCFLQTVYSQGVSAPKPVHPVRLLIDSLKRGNYLGALNSLKAREKTYLEFKPLSSPYFEILVQANIFVGDYSAASAAEEQLYSTYKRKLDARRAGNSFTVNPNFNGYVPISAREAILKAADTSRLIIINEEHREPAHRALTISLLDSLYQKGFRYLAAETLVSGDSLLNERGYAVRSSGFYAADPVYATMLREARRIGFTLIAYEYERDCNFADLDSCQEERERGQAENIVQRILNSNPLAKILVHVGRSHASKSILQGQYAFMAWHLRKLSGIEPFTVDMVTYSPANNPLDEHVNYRYARENGLLLSVPTAFFSKENGYLTQSGYNMQVFTPKSVGTGQRPTWRSLSGKARAHHIEMRKLAMAGQKGLFVGKDNVLVRAVHLGEQADSVPADQVVLYPGKQIPVLYLMPGKYRIELVDVNGRVITSYSIAQR